MKESRICVIGAGKWGENHIKTLISLQVHVEIVEKNESRVKELKILFPKIKIYPSIEIALNKKYDGYIITTPSQSHFDLATLLISNQKNVLVEKPMTTSISDAHKLSREVEKSSSIFLVGHLLLFHPAIIKIKSMLTAGLVGDIQYIYSNRLNLGTLRTEEDSFWSLAPHDISLFQYFSDSFPVRVNSFGSSFLQKNIYDSVISSLKYPNGIEGHIYVSWLHPFKEHRIVITGTNGMIYFEDSKDEKPLLFYEKENQEPLILKNKNYKKIEYGLNSPLKNELIYFLNAINGGPKDKVNIQKGLDVVKILEMGSFSMEKNKLK